MDPIRVTRRLSLTGLFAVAITFGPARVNYGLFLPYLRDEFDLSTTALGIIASGLHTGNLLALVAVVAAATRVGARTPVLIGLVSAAAGLGLMAISWDARVLTVGVILAGTGAGWTWSPYNDVAEGGLPIGLRNRVLSVVSTGGTVGILTAGVLALVFGSNWRTACLVSAGAALAALLANTRVLRGSRGGPAADVRAPSPRYFVTRSALPLFAVAFYFGVTDAFYLSFAVDLVAGASRLSVAQAGGGVFVLMGAAGLVALFAGAAVAWFGLTPMLRAAVAALGVAALMLGVAPSSMPLLVASAMLFGAGAMMISALLSIWSSDIFPDHPSVGFTATLMAYGVGLVIGPAALGVVADASGLSVAFVVVAALSVPCVVMKPRGGVRHGTRSRPRSQTSTDLLQ